MTTGINKIVGTFPAGTEADVNSKLGVTFSVESLIDGKAIKVHQAFISLQNTASEVTTTFIAEADEKMLYTASCKYIYHIIWLIFRVPIIFVLVDVKDHMEFSGTYKVTLVVGDPIMHPGSVILPLGEVTITGLPESTVTGSWNRKYLEKVRFCCPEIGKMLFVATDTVKVILFTLVR